MSEWHEITRDDMSISLKDDEVNIHIGTNYNGSIWVHFKIKDIKNLLKEKK